MDRRLLLVAALLFCDAQVSFCQNTTSPPLTKKPKDKDQHECEEFLESREQTECRECQDLTVPAEIKGDQGDQGEAGQGDKGDRGATGPEGNKGDRGSRGHTGSPGKTGQSGPKGDRGSSGAKGEAGQKGDAAAAGPISPANWKQCVWNTDDTKDSGKLKECSFNKLQGSTALRVSFQGNMRVEGSGTKCNRWYFKFNGNECSGPMTIEAVVYNNWPSGNPNLLHHRSFEGYCENLQRGAITVELWVGKCTGIYNQGNAHTAWNSASRIMVEELPRSQ